MPLQYEPVGMICSVPISKYNSAPANIPRPNTVQNCRFCRKDRRYFQSKKAIGSQIGFGKYGCTGCCVSGRTKAVSTMSSTRRVSLAWYVLLQKVHDL